MYSDPQAAALQHGIRDETLFVAIGSVRSGKTWSVGIAFAAWLSQLKEPYDHALLAASVEVAMRNLGFDLLQHVTDLGGQAEVRKVYGTCIHVRYPTRPEQKVWVVGASDERSRKRLQGATLAGLVVEELPILPEAAWDFAWSRLSVEGAKCWITGNPEGPANYCKRKVIDRIEAFHGRHQVFLLRDNPTLSEDTIRRYESSFTGFQYRRLIEGQWAAASGACWPEWVSCEDTIEWPVWSLALDWAVSGTLAVLAINHPRPPDRANVMFELFHEGREDGLLTEQKAVERICAWWREHVGHTDGVGVYADPSMPQSVQLLLRRSGFHIRPVDNDVLPGIVSTGAWLSTGELRVHERCRKLRDEMASYVWDEKASEIGEDKPVKQADHGCDALRYFAYNALRRRLGSGAPERAILPMRPEAAASSLADRLYGRDDRMRTVQPIGGRFGRR